MWRPARSVGIVIIPSRDFKWPGESEAAWEQPGALGEHLFVGSSPEWSLKTLRPVVWTSLLYLGGGSQVISDCCVLFLYFHISFYKVVELPCKCVTI